jgi:hypothetical protein
LRTYIGIAPVSGAFKNCKLRPQQEPALRPFFEERFAGWGGVCGSSLLNAQGSQCMRYASHRRHTRGGLLSRNNSNLTMPNVGPIHALRRRDEARPFTYLQRNPCPGSHYLDLLGQSRNGFCAPAAYSSIAKGGPEFKAHLRAQRLHADRTLTNCNDCNGQPRLRI